MKKLKSLSNQEKLINVLRNSENPFFGRLLLRFSVFWLKQLELSRIVSSLGVKHGRGLTVFSTTRNTFGKKATSNLQAREFFLCFVVKFFNVQLRLKTAFHRQKKLLSFNTWLGERVNEFLHLNSPVNFHPINLSRKILKRDRICYLHIINK